MLRFYLSNRNAKRICQFNHIHLFVSNAEQYTEFSNFTACNTTCVTGKQSRTRECRNVMTNLAATGCGGPDVEVSQVSHLTQISKVACAKYQVG